MQIFEIQHHKSKDAYLTTWQCCLGSLSDHWDTQHLTFKAAKTRLPTSPTNAADFCQHCVYSALQIPAQAKLKTCLRIPQEYQIKW